MFSRSYRLYNVAIGTHHLACDNRRNRDVTIRATATIPHRNRGVTNLSRSTVLYTRASFNNWVCYTIPDLPDHLRHDRRAGRARAAADREVEGPEQVYHEPDRHAAVDAEAQRGVAVPHQVLGREDERRGDACAGGRGHWRSNRRGSGRASHAHRYSTNGRADFLPELQSGCCTPNLCTDT